MIQDASTYGFRQVRRFLAGNRGIAQAELTEREAYESSVANVALYFYHLKSYNCTNKSHITHAGNATISFIAGHR